MFDIADTLQVVSAAGADGTLSLKTGVSLWGRAAGVRACVQQHVLRSSTLTLYRMHTHGLHLLAGSCPYATSHPDLLKARRALICLHFLARYVPTKPSMKRILMHVA